MKILNFTEFNEAIGFKIAGDNRDQETYQPRTNLGYKDFNDQLSDKLINLIRKLKAMAERGEPGERDVAKEKLAEISQKYSINVDKYLQDRTTGKLGYKFSWEDEEYMDDVNKGLRKSLA
jgi:hypothetical protein